MPDGDPTLREVGAKAEEAVSALYDYLADTPVSQLVADLFGSAVVLALVSFGALLLWLFGQEAIDTLADPARSGSLGFRVGRWVRRKLRLSKP